MVKETEPSGSEFNVSGSALRVLILEDSASDADLIQRELRRASIVFSATVLETREDLLRELDEHRPDLVLSDYSMPRLSGIEVIELLKERAPAIPVIIVTGALDDETAVACIKAGATDYVLKERLTKLAPALRRAVREKQLAEERDLAERALRDREAFLDTFLNAIPVPVFYKNTEGVYLGCNRAFEAFFGAPSGQIVGKTTFDLNPPELAAIYEAKDQELLANGGVQRYEAQVKDSRGDLHDVIFSKAVLTDQMGTVTGLTGAILDITAKKRAEESMLASEERYRQLFARIGEGVAITGIDERFVLANPAAHAIFGVPAENLVGRSVTEFLDDGGVSVVAEQSARRLGGESGEYELTIVRAGGERRQLIVNTTPQVDPDGVVVGTFGVFRDITGLRAAEDQLRQSQKMEAIGRLAGGVAHDFNNQLQVVEMYCDLAQSGLRPDDPIVDAISQIRGAAQRSAKLTRQLLAFSRRQALAPSVIDLNQTVGEMDRMLRRLVGEDIEVTTVLAPDLARVKADVSQLEQVVVNLVVNAREAMAAGGRLTIETANAEVDESFAHSHPEVEPGSYVVVAVSDTGCGMDEATRSKVFEPFFTTKKQGTGLGLAMVHGIVRQSGGHIFCYSAPNHGATFRVYLPTVEEELAPSTPIRVPEITRGTGTLLVVEDEVALRTIITKMLTKEGYTVLAAANGGEALLLSRKHQGKINLLVTDVVMPGMSGKELANELTSLRPDMKVLFMSGYTSNAIVHHGHLDDGAAFLQKPFNIKTLASKIREVL